MRQEFGSPLNLDRFDSTEPKEDNEVKERKNMTEEMDEEVKRIYTKRQERREHPSGKTDNGGRWYPTDEERCVCCASVRGPSRAYPWSLMRHCRTRKHITKLVQKRAGL